MAKYIKLLSDLSFSIGLIGYAEYFERFEIADWLEDTSNTIVDPRSHKIETLEELTINENTEVDEKYHISKAGKIDDECLPWLELLLINKWMFTIGDADCYPSVPHGHLQKKTREWPKLNPYTGRVFSSVHKEDDSKRLSKLEMKTIWNDSKFVDHCREQILWYIDFSPNYGFPMARRGRFVFPKW